MQAHSALEKPARIHYRSAAHGVSERDAIDFPTLADALAFAMTQSPHGRELAFIRTQEGRTLGPEQVSALWRVSQPSH